MKKILLTNYHFLPLSEIIHYCLLEYTKPLYRYSQNKARKRTSHEVIVRININKPCSTYAVVAQLLQAGISSGLLWIRI